MKKKFLTYEELEKMDVLEYFECDCHSSKHSFTFGDSPDIEGNFTDPVYLHIHMAQYMPWYKRIVPAIRYILGHKSKYGDWDSVLLKQNDLERLKRLLDQAIERRSKNDGK